MCGICGCDEPETGKIDSLSNEKIDLHQAIMSENQQDADHNRALLQTKQVLGLNLVSSPGSGKTTLLCQLLPNLITEYGIWVIEGDQQTDRDAQRVKETGAKVTQINTGKMCHLDAHGVGHAIADFQIDQHGFLFVENVGNLVCPAMFDLGEDTRIAILSVTEGDDKPIKYPDMFHTADIMLINKIDLLPYVDFDVSRCIEFAKQVNPNIQVLLTSATTYEGMEELKEVLVKLLSDKTEIANKVA